MTNYIQPGNTVTVTAPRAVTSGTGVLVGSMFGVAKNAAASGATDLEMAVEGVFEMAKASGAIAAFAKVYWDNTAFNVTTVTTSNSLIGVATQAQLSGDTTVRVRLNGISL